MYCIRLSLIGLPSARASFIRRIRSSDSDSKLSCSTRRLTIFCISFSAEEVLLGEPDLEVVPLFLDVLELVVFQLVLEHLFFAAQVLDDHRHPGHLRLGVALARIHQHLFLILLPPLLVEAVIVLLTCWSFLRAFRSAGSPESRESCLIFSARS